MNLGELTDQDLSPLFQYELKDLLNKPILLRKFYTHESGEQKEIFIYESKILEISKNEKYVKILTSNTVIGPLDEWVSIDKLEQIFLDII